MSKKRAKLKRLMDPKRTAFVLDAEWCMACGSEYATDCHEIARGVHREKCLEHPRLWLALCRRCHEGNVPQWSLARQLALRLDWELVRSVEELNQVRGRPDTAVTVAEVWEEMS